MNLFSFLQGISPWWWLAFGVALGAVEMATMSFFLIWPAIGAAIIAGVLLVLPDLAPNAQIALFAVLAVVLTFAGRALLNRFGDGGEASDDLNDRARMMIGRHAKVDDFIGPEGTVIIDGVRWHALWSGQTRAKRGDSVKITGVDGMSLLVGSD